MLPAQAAFQGTFLLIQRLGVVRLLGIAAGAVGADDIQILDLQRCIRQRGAAHGGNHLIPQLGCLVRRNAVGGQTPHISRNAVGRCCQGAHRHGRDFRHHRLRRRCRGVGQKRKPIGGQSGKNQCQYRHQHHKQQGTQGQTAAPHFFMIHEMKDLV